MHPILDFAIVGNRIFSDAALLARGPMAWYQERTAKVRSLGLNTRAHALIAKWFTGSARAPGGRVLWDMRKVTPSAWLDELPAVFKQAKDDYAKLIIYTGALHNATPSGIRELCYWYLDVCGADTLVIDAAGTIPEITKGVLTSPLTANLHAVVEEVRARIVPDIMFEPPPFDDTFQTVMGGTYLEEGFADGKWTGDWYYKGKSRNMPPAASRDSICAISIFDKAHAIKRMEEGWKIGVNFSNPIVAQRLLEGRATG